MSHKPSKELRRARRVVDEYPDLQVVHDLTWFEDVKRWGMCIDVKIAQDDARELAEQTRWWVVIDPFYPWGHIDVFPDLQDGIEKTFHHQNRNDPPRGSGIPWRRGKVCFWAPHHVFGRRAIVSEPIGNIERLRWVFIQLREWIRRAGSGALVAEGDPFELPDFCASEPLVAFSESVASFDLWSDVQYTHGIAEMGQLHKGAPLVVREFKTPQGKLLVKPSWGTVISEAPSQPVAVWIRLTELPVLPPFRAPATWGEFRSAVKNSGIRHDDILEKALATIRDGLRHIALIGFPIPQEYGPAKEPHQMHWQALSLPIVSRGRNYCHGFRPNAKGYWMRDRQKFFRDSDTIQWLKSINWHEDQVSGRGRINPVLSGRRIAIIGAGAIGSVLAELLVRGGVRELFIVDADTVEAGNLVRHTLSLADVGKPKAAALADHLNQVSPHARVEGVVEAFPHPLTAESETKLKECEVVLDCSATDDVLRVIGDWKWKSGTAIFSLSLGFEAERLYLLSGMPGTDYMRLLEEAFKSELEIDKELLESAELPTEATGCWHPLFPARIDRIWAMVGIAIGHIENMITSGEAITAMLLKWADGQVTVERRIWDNV